MAVNTIKGKQDTGWLTLTTGIIYRRVDGIVYVIFENYNLPASTGTQTIGTLPEGFRPSVNVQPLVRIGATLLVSWITSSGAINIGGSSSTQGLIAGSASFPVN